MSEYILGKTAYIVHFKSTILILFEAIGVHALPFPCVSAHVIQSPGGPPAQQAVRQRHVRVVSRDIARATRHYLVRDLTARCGFEGGYHLEDGIPDSVS